MRRKMSTRFAQGRCSYAQTNNEKSLRLNKRKSFISEVAANLLLAAGPF
jgi:hypothetical protein